MPDYERIRQILRSPQAQSINFVCQGVPVNPSLFSAVAQAVGSTDLHQQIVNVRIDSVAVGNAGALYQPAANTFLLRDTGLNRIYDEVTVVHEAVHCGFDLQRRANWRWFGQEACAYIAGALYAINKNVPSETIVSWNDNYSNAYNIARQIRPGTTVTWEQYLPLRTCLLAAARNPNSIYYRFADDMNYGNNG